MPENRAAISSPNTLRPNSAKCLILASTSSPIPSLDPLKVLKSQNATIASASFGRVQSNTIEKRYTSENFNKLLAHTNESPHRNTNEIHHLSSQGTKSLKTSQPPSQGSLTSRAAPSSHLALGLNASSSPSTFNDALQSWTSISARRNSEISRQNRPLGQTSTSTNPLSQLSGDSPQITISPSSSNTLFTSTLSTTSNATTTTTVTSTSSTTTTSATILADNDNLHKLTGKSQSTSKKTSNPYTNIVVMAPSRRLFRPATVAFMLDEDVENLNAEDIVKVERKDSKYYKKLNGDHLAVYYRFGTPALEYKVIKDTFIRAGLVKAPEVDDFEFNILWSRHLKSHEYYKLNKYQKVNHFPGSEALSRKDSMHRALKRQKNRLGSKEYGFFPESYFLAQDRDKIISKLKKGKIFIMKPPGSSCGRGIELILSPDALPDPSDESKNKYLFQEYLRNPFLIENKKWDLRIYVLVTSYNPVRIYVFHNGLVRFCTEDYNINSTSRFSHLTNFSVNKQSGQFVYNTNHEEDDKGSKWSIQGLKRYFKKIGIDDTSLWKQIDDIIVKTIIAVEPKVTDLMKRYMPGRRSQSCFELYGFDVMVCHDSSKKDTDGKVAPSPSSEDTEVNLQPWVIEVNVAPSLSIGSELDKYIKRQLLTDTLHIIGINPYNRKKVGDQIELRKKKRQKKREKIEKEIQETMRQQRIGASVARPPTPEKEKEKNGAKVKDLLNSKFTLKSLTTKDYNLICELQDEEDKIGGFVRVFPTAERSYEKIFESYSYNNALLYKWLNTPPEIQEKLLRKHERSLKSKKKQKAKKKLKKETKPKK